VLRSPPWHGWSLWNIGVTNDQGYLPLVVSTSRSFLVHELSPGCNYNNATGVSSGAGTAYPSGAPEFIPVLSGFVLLDLRSLVLCVCFVDTCLSICLFSVGHFVVVLLRYINSDNPFGIFKLFLVDLCYGAKPTSFNNNLSIQIWGTAPCVRKFSQLFLNQFKIDVHNITLSSATLYRYNYTN
jgi:hypothetical protein